RVSNRARGANNFFFVWKKEFVLRKISAVRCGNCGKNIRDCGKDFSQLRGLEVSKSRSDVLQQRRETAQPRDRATASAALARDRRARSPRESLRGLRGGRGTLRRPQISFPGFCTPEKIGAPLPSDAAAVRGSIGRC